MIISIQKLQEKSTQGIIPRIGLKSLSVSLLAAKAMNTLSASPGAHSAFVKSDGSLWTMGNNEDGQLGINSFDDANLTTEVSLGSISMMVSIGNPMHGPDLFINLAKHNTFLEEQGSNLKTAQDIVTRMQELKISSATASNADVSIYNAEFTSLQRQLYDISQVSVGGENLFAKYATDAYGNSTFTDAVFGGQNQDPNSDHTFDIQVKEVGEDVSLGGSVSIGSVSLGMLNLFSINRGLLLSALNIDTASLGSSGYGYNWNTSANGNDNHQFTATLAVPNWGQTLELDDISIGVLDQAATNLVFLRTQNGTQHTKLQEYHSKKVDYEVAKVAIGDGHSIFVLKGDYAYTTGRGGSGQLANGSTNNQSNYSFALSNVKAVAAGGNHSLFLLNDGSLYGSGGNDSGQLGLNHENNQTWPTQILASGVKSISAQNSHTLVVRNDGSLWGTGANNHYQLGLNDNIKRSQLTQIVSSGVKESESGGAFSLFIKEDGSLWGMGVSNFGQLGMGNNNLHTTPVEIVPSGVRQVSAGQRHSLFIKNDGSVWGMGSNENGRLGLSDINATNLPVQILPNGAKEVSTGLTHSLILMLDGTLLGSGVNSDGQLGLGDLNGRTTFTKIATGVMRLADVMNNEHIVPSANNMEMLWVDPGTFTMGSPVTEVGRTTWETEHNVTLTRGFFLGKYEVTQAEYQAVMTGNTNGLSATPSQYNGNPDRPVEKVSWNDIHSPFLTMAMIG
jgi:alpha-tubulin suppressor-like RCC1 family protein